MYMSSLRLSADDVMHVISASWPSLVCTDYNNQFLILFCFVIHPSLEAPGCLIALVRSERPLKHLVRPQINRKQACLLSSYAGTAPHCPRPSIRVRTWRTFPRSALNWMRTHKVPSCCPRWARVKWPNRRSSSCMPASTLAISPPCAKYVRVTSIWELGITNWCNAYVWTSKH